MGLFSWDCYACEHPLLMPGNTGNVNGWMSDGVAFTITGKKIEGCYDGYGALGGVEISPETPEAEALLQRALYRIRKVAGAAGIIDWGFDEDNPLKLSKDLHEDIKEFLNLVEGPDSPDRDASWDRLLVYHRACWDCLGNPRKRATAQQQSKSSDCQGHFCDPGDHDKVDPRMDGVTVDLSREDGWKPGDRAPESLPHEAAAG